MNIPIPPRIAAEEIASLNVTGSDKSVEKIGS